MRVIEGCIEVGINHYRIQRSYLQFVKDFVFVETKRFPARLRSFNNTGNAVYILKRLNRYKGTDLQYPAVRGTVNKT